MLRDRLRRALDELEGGTQAGLAAACNVRPPSVHAWFTGETKTLKGTSLLAAATYLGVSPEWLATGRGPMRIPVANRLSTSLSTDSSEVVPLSTSAGEIAPGYVRLPLLDGFVAAGDGGYVADYPEVVQEIDVAEDWLRRNVAAPAERVRVITAQGDSMQPDISSGDVLFVDSGVTWFDSDAVYVMNWRGRPIVKRLQLRRDGRLLIRSTNPAYEPEEVPPDEIESLHISGRVVGAWHFRKY